MNLANRSAPGGPGIPARWTSSAKTGVGTALSNKSHVWFTLSHGIFNEIYYPRIDQACIRDMGMIVTDGADFFSEEKRDADSKIHWLADGVPAFQLVNTCRQGRYRIEKEIVTDPHRDTVLQQSQFIAQQGALSDYHLHVLLAPHLGNQGAGNTAWVEEFEGTPLLFAQRNDSALALACSAPWTKRSVGYVGSSDGWQDLKAHKQMTWEYTRAENGNVALTAEIDLSQSQGDFVLALGFGRDPDEAARNAIASLQSGFDKAKHDYIAGWQEWIKTHASLKKSILTSKDLSQISLAVLRTHESKTAPGGLIASLSIPWGASKGDNDLGGYHLVWSRDMVETAGALLAAGAHEDVRRVLSYLQTDPAAGWALAAEHVAGWLALLERNPNGRDGFANSPGGSGPSRKSIDQGRCGPVLADGAASRGLFGSQWPGEPAGSLGGRSRLFAIHGRSRNRGTPGGGGSGRFESRSIHCNLPPRDRRCLEHIHRTLDVCVRHGLVPQVQRRRILCPDRPE